MEPRFTRGEYWLLEAVVEHALPICWLIRDDLEVALNKESHGRTSTQVQSTLVDLCAAGLIEAHMRGHSENGFVPDVEQIRAALTESDRDKWTYYRLTTKGGQDWETFAMPCWNRFVSAYSEPLRGDRMAGCVTAQHDSLALAYLSGLHYVNVSVVPTSIRQEQISPWNAPYWKTLPDGHRIRYMFTKEEGIPDWGRIPSAYMDIWSPRWYRCVTGK